ncbi:diguanylate cyclase [Gammaproteobacteria bacterium]
MQVDQVLKQQREQTEHIATHDALTGLANRQLFESHLIQALAKSEREGTLGAVAFLDLDGFKAINDNFSHEHGDQLLVQISECLIANIRNTDTLARLGGDEFILLVEGCRQPGDVAAVVEHIFRCVGRYYKIGERQIFVTWSCGVAVFPQDGKDPQTLIKHADTAMYRAKATGANQMRLYDSRMSDEVALQLALREELRQALESENQFHVYYQPLVDPTGRIIGAEALVRWHHPLRGVVSPIAFIGVAEQAGLIPALGERVLRLATTDTATWRRMGYATFHIHVNVSVRQLAQRDFLERLTRILTEVNLPPDALHIEVTESVLIDDTGQTETTLASIKALGVGVSLDDFGTGYSSLAYLQGFSLDNIKIDKSFVADIPGDINDCALAGAILALGQKLGIEVVAEGVESEDQRDWLTLQGCRRMQGYLFGRPLPAPAFLALLQSNQDIPS